MAGTYNIRCDQGTDFEKTFTVATQAGPLDLTDYSARMHIRYRLEYPSPPALSLDSNGGISLDANGHLVVSMTDTQTAALTKDGVYDIELVDPAGKVHRILQGQFILNREVTR